MLTAHFPSAKTRNLHQSFRLESDERKLRIMTKNRRNERRDDGWPELLSVEEAAEFLRLKRSTLDHYRCEGRGPIYRKHGARVFYPKPDLIRWSERNSYASTSERLQKPE